MIGHRILAWLHQAWSLDRRSLALMRIAYGLLILTDLAIRCRYFEEHYGPQGGFPISVLFQSGLQATDLCLHSINGTSLFLTIIFLAHVVAALLLLVGWRTRLMTVLCFVLALSLQNRNFLVLNGGDNWLRLVLFWAIFLPWGERFSVDSLKEPKPSDDRVFSLATFGYINQMMMVYFVSALYKTGPAWRTEGSAIYLSLRQLEWNADFGLFLLYFPAILKGLTFSIILFEFIGPWMLVSPFFTERARLLGTLGFMGFHLGLEMFMELGIFPWVGVCSLLGLLPGIVWKSKWGSKAESALSALFSRRRFRDALIQYSGSSVPVRWRVCKFFLILVLLFTYFWNLGGRDSERLVLPQAFKIGGKLFGLHQYWGLFAPEPGRVGGWIILEGHFADGTTLDLKNGQAVEWKAPTSSSIYPTQRIKRWYVVLAQDQYQQVRPAYANFLFRKWDKEHNEKARLERVRGYWLSRDTLPNFEDAEIRRHLFMDLTREQVGL